MKLAETGDRFLGGLFTKLLRLGAQGFLTIDALRDCSEVLRLGVELSTGLGISAGSNHRPCLTGFRLVYYLTLL